ncbi:hypothetical protein D3C80_1531020 [compost metagenome]
MANTLRPAQRRQSIRREHPHVDGVGLVAAEDQQVTGRRPSHNKANVSATLARKDGDGPRRHRLNVDRLAPLGIRLGRLEATGANAAAFQHGADKCRAPWRLVILDAAAADIPPHLQHLGRMARAGNFRHADQPAGLFYP